MKNNAQPPPDRYYFQIEWHSPKDGTEECHGCVIHFVPTAGDKRNDEGALAKIVQQISLLEGVRDIRSININSGKIDIISNFKNDWMTLLEQVLLIISNILPSKEGFKQVENGHIIIGQKIDKSIDVLRSSHMIALGLSKMGYIKKSAY